MQSKYRLGVDAGGTFTDFVLAVRDEGVRIYKTPSTPDDPTRAMAAGLSLIADSLGCGVADVISNCDFCINGTTVGLNALIQAKGARLGLICTRGHEDSLEIRLGHKDDGYRYDPDFPPAHTLVERYLRIGISERMRSDGVVVSPLDDAEIVAACDILRKAGVEAVAISFVWSPMNPSHEQRAAAIVRRELPGVYVSVGSDVFPQIREFTRTSTAVVNAYIGPIIERYVSRIDGFFRDLGASQPVRYFQSNGGLAFGPTFSENAVYALNSGPASAPGAGLSLGAEFGITNVITVDMGGTSFDITLTHEGRTNLVKDVDFLRQRVGIPMVQIETLGAGGGSIASVDAMGMFSVGPQSAGAQPGPACYGNGGQEPTVTDANIVLGYLSPAGLLKGQFALDKDAAYRAIEERIAKPLGISVERAAYGIHTVVNNNMVNGVRRVSLEKGYDPRDFALIGAGGATGAHITAIAEELGITTILVSRLASGLCAYGQIISDVKYDMMATMPTRLEDRAVAHLIENRLRQLEDESQKKLRQDGFSDKQIRFQRLLDMRYVGQLHECTVDVSGLELVPETLADVISAFHARHEQLFTYAEYNSTVEVMNLHVSAIGLVERPAIARVEAGGSDPSPALKSNRDMILSMEAGRQPCPVYDGELLRAGNLMQGPCLIEEPTTTLLIGERWQAVLEPSGTYRVTARAEA